MVRVRKILWTPTAIKQRNHVFEYWNNRNKSTAFSKKLNEKIKEKIKLLRVNSELGIGTGFNNTRVIILKHYSILYKKIDYIIIVTGFWDNRQDPKKLIEFLKNN